jgi:glycine/D-amino acid oxidase-like deaminating enzyme
MPGDTVVIAGAGIIGASIAYHLARRGAKVIVLDAGEPGSRATGKSLGWINATFSKHPRAYFDLNCAGIAAWRRLELELRREIDIQWGGSVAWFPPGAEARGAEANELRENIRNHQAWGYPVRVVEQHEFQQLLPKIAPGKIAVACHCESEGAVDPVHALTVLLNKARERGAELRYPCPVTGLDLARGRVETSDGSLEASLLLLACGVDSSALAAMAGVRVPLKDSPGVLVHKAPAPHLIDRVVLAPGVHFKQSADGRVVAGGPIVAGAGTAITHASVEQADAIRARLEQYLPAMKNVPTEQVTLGHRVMPLDEYPIVGFSEECPNLYIAVTHSGVTLAPLIGELAAIEILDRVPVDALAPYRASRF